MELCLITVNKDSYFSQTKGLIHMKKIYDKLPWWLRDNEQGFVFLTDQGFVFLTDEGFDQYEDHFEADHSAQILITVWASSAC